MPTRRSLFFMFFAIISYLGATIVEVPALMYIGGTLFALLAFSFVWVWFSSFGIGCKFTCDRQGVTGAPVTLCFSLRNAWPVPRYGLFLGMSFPPGDEMHRSLTVWLDELRPSGTTDVQVHVTAVQRGRFKLGPVTLTYQDPLGLFAIKRRFSIDHEIEILPSWVRLDSFPFIETSVGMKDPQRSIPRPGYSSEFYAIRPYMQGDSPRWIHWLSTMRMQKLMTRQFQSPVQRRIVVILDCAAGGPFKFLTRSEPFETAVVTAASIAQFGAETDHEVGLITLGADEPPVRPAPGIDNLRHIFSVLAEVKQEGKRTTEESRRKFDLNVQSLIFVTSSPGPQFYGDLQNLRSRGREVFVVLVEESETGPSKRFVEHMNYFVSHGIQTCHVSGRGTLKHDLENPIGIPGGLKVEAERDFTPSPQSTANGRGGRRSVSRPPLERWQQQTTR